MLHIKKRIKKLIYLHIEENALRWKKSMKVYIQ